MTPVPGDPVSPADFHGHQAHHVIHTGRQSALRIRINLNIFNNNTILPIRFTVKLPYFLELVPSV